MIPSPDDDLQADGCFFDTLIQTDLLDWNWHGDGEFGAVYYLEIFLRGRWRELPLPTGATRGEVRRILSGYRISFPTEGAK